MVSKLSQMVAKVAQMEPKGHQNGAQSALALDSGNRPFLVVYKSQVPGAFGR
jgi:hypothetical protein